MGLYATTQLARSGLVNLWQLNETSGTTAADSKGTNNGTITGGVTLNQPGAFVGGGDNTPSMLFDGVSGTSIDVANASAMNYSAPLSAEGVIRPLALAGVTLITKGVTAAPGWSMFISSDGRLQGGIGFTLVQSAPNLIVAGAWHHVAMTLDANSQLTLWLNGQVVATQTGMPTYTAPASALHIAGGDFASPLHGYMQDWSLYNRVLTSREISTDAAIMSLQFPPHEVDKTIVANAGWARRPHPVNDANYTIAPTDSVIFITALTASRTLTLPPPSALQVGQSFTIKDMSGQVAGRPVTIAAPGGVTIDGAASIQITSNRGSVGIITDGTNYGVV
jgi:hypothetical protein